MARPRRSTKLLRRKGHWYLIRRVPKEFHAIDPRGVVLLSSGIRITDDPTGQAARAVIAQRDQELFAAWRHKAAGLIEDPKARQAAVHRTAGELGLDYLPAADLAAMPVAKILERINLIGNPTEQPLHLIETVLGGIAKPDVKLSDLRTIFEEVEAITLATKSPRQLAVWRTHRQTAVDTFINVLGADKALHTLTREDALTFRRYLQKRVLNGEIAIDTANKTMGRVSSMLRSVNEHLMLNVPAIFEKSLIRGGKDEQRTPYEVAFVQDRLLATGALASLNDEARRVLYVVAETGLRLSEACNLNETTIHLADEVPYVEVTADGRQMKTAHSARKVPLVGCALMALRLQPQGFPRYADNANALSAVLNKALRSKNLTPKGESVYSLRHTFKDRLRAVQAPGEMIDELMGHKTDVPVYGFGYPLKVKAEWLARIAFRPPSEV